MFCHVDYTKCAFFLGSDSLYELEKEQGLQLYERLIASEKYFISTAHLWDKCGK